MSRFQALTDDQWAPIMDLLPGPTGTRGRPFADARTLVEGIILVSGRDRLALSALNVRAVADSVAMAQTDG